MMGRYGHGLHTLRIVRFNIGDRDRDSQFINMMGRYGHGLHTRCVIRSNIERSRTNKIFDGKPWVPAE